MSADDALPAEDLARLASRAHEARVVVIGGGVSGLVAALECAKVGLAVTVLEADDRLGGVVRSAEVDGLTLDVGAESYATRGGAVRALIDELGIADRVTSPRPGGAWLSGIPGGAAPLPKGGVLGIPANPWAPEVRRIIGWRGAWRAYLDRVRPPLTIGHEHNLGALVRSRMGERVLDRLVAPVSSGVYSAHPDDIDVDVAAPGLNAALTRTGSLSGAVFDLRGGGGKTPGAAVEGLRGGMGELVSALTTRLRDLGVELRTDSPVSRIERAGDGWLVGVDGGPDAESAAAAGAIPASAVIVATSEGVARGLCAPVVPGLSSETGAVPVVEVVTLVMDAPALDAHPRGAGVLAVPGTSDAKALTHSTAKWAWLADAVPAGRHVVRVSFGAQGEAPATELLDDGAAVDLAVREAAGMLGVSVDALVVRDGRRDRYEQAQPAATIGRAAETAAVRETLAAVPGLGIVGAWLSGTGLAQVVPDAGREAHRVRSGVLWAPSDDAADA